MSSPSCELAPSGPAPVSDQPRLPGSLAKGVKTVAEFLADPDLCIPDYQRPYKWTARHINQLFADINRHKDKNAYRLGTIVFHREGKKRNIVDGQQRTISLVLAIHALVETRINGPQETRIQNPELAACLENLANRMLNPGFNNRLSQSNIRNNYQAIRRIVSRPEFTEDSIAFLLHRCEIVWFELQDISEAFQFFDSQNARGRDLEPHDLLKAFHLREFSSQDEHEKALAVSHWETIDSERLAELFGDYLFRIRNWSRNAPARYFGKEHIPLFKGVNLAQAQPYPFTQQLLIANRYTDDFNRQLKQDAGNARKAFPFQLDQPVINGRRFFEMTAHYNRATAFIQESQQADAQLSGFAPRILETLNQYSGRRRTGDRYVRLLFDCLLISYIDKFGLKEISWAVERTFIWAYSLRLRMQVLQLASLDNYVLENNRFLTIKEATQPADFLSIDYPALSRDIRASQVEDITKLFRQMGYYHD